jgi:hypothetical protein
MRRLPAVLLLTGMLTACSVPAADWGPRRPCPVVLREYPATEQKRVADLLEERAVPDPLPRWLDDYGRLRAEVRAACGLGG